MKPVVIRSHGVEQSIYNEMESRSISYTDATCPFVAKIHRIVAKAAAEGKTVLIAGDPDHPEVVGIRGHAGENVFVVRNADELQKRLETLKNSQNPPCILVAQTTYHTTFWRDCFEVARKHYTNIEILIQYVVRPVNVRARRQSLPP